MPKQHPQTAYRKYAVQYGFVASGARKDRKFDSGLGGGALLDIGIYNLGFLRILTGQDPEVIRCPVDINGFEYEIREESRCVKLGHEVCGRGVSAQLAAGLLRAETMRR